MDPQDKSGEPVTLPDEQCLLRQFRAGSHAACAELVRCHYAAVYRFLAHLTGNVHQAEDLTQETFAAAWEKLATFEGRSALATWLHRIAYTKFIDAQRAERRSAAALAQRPAIAAVAVDPADQLLADDDASKLYAALDRLEVPARTVLVLHYLQGLSYRDMAMVLAEPAGTVKWRTAEALGRLRLLLESQETRGSPALPR